MAQNTIDIRFTKFASGDGQSAIENGGKPTSSINQFMKKSSSTNGLGGNVVKGIRTLRTFKTTATLGSFGGGTAPIAIAQEMGRAVKSGLNIYASIETAKTGERMRYHNFNQTLNIFTNPIGFAKKGLWDNGYLRNLEIARENEMLQYARQLTGDLIYSKNTQHQGI